jgi:hypothetical protein
VGGTAGVSFCEKDLIRGIPVRRYSDWTGKAGGGASFYLEVVAPEYFRTNPAGLPR